MAGYLNTAYTLEQIKALPDLLDTVQTELDGTPTGYQRARAYINKSMADPAAYIKQHEINVAYQAQQEQLAKSSSGVFGFISDALSSVGNAIQNVGDAVADTVKKAADGAADVVRYAADHPLQTIEAIAVVVFAPELAETLGVSVPTATAIANTAVAVANGAKNPEDIAKAAIASYAGAEASAYVTPAASSAATAAGASPTFVKVISSAAGADAAATTSSLIKNNGDLQKALDDGTKAAITSLVASASTAAGQQVAAQIEDPTLAKVAGAATKAGTTAALRGKDAGSAALSAAGEAAKQPLLDAAGNIIGDVASNVDLSSVKDTFKPVGEAIGKITQPISDVATKTLQPISDIATTVLQPLEAPIRGVVQKGSDIATSIAEPVGKGISKIADASGKALSSLGGNLSGDALDKSIIDLMAKAPGDTISGSTSGTTVAGGPAVSDVASGAAASPAAFGGADVAMLGDTSPEGMGSKVSKKGGKYPWGEPEGTTALKEGLGIG
jgi:hypothetical protein